MFKVLRTKDTQLGENCEEEMLREAYYVGHETDKMAWERFLGATSPLQHRPGRVCLHRVAWKKAGKLQADYSVIRTIEAGKGGQTPLNIWKEPSGRAS